MVVYLNDLKILAKKKSQIENINKALDKKAEDKNKKPPPKTPQTQQQNKE